MFLNVHRAKKWGGGKYICSPPHFEKWGAIAPLAPPLPTPLRNIHVAHDFRFDVTACSNCHLGQILWKIFEASLLTL